MDPGGLREQDRRTQRTRKAIYDGFVRLLFSRRYSAIRIADIIEAAGVGRSTFYEHFRNKDEVLVAAIDPIFIPLAEAGAGRGDVGAVRFVLDHVWDQRAAARVLFEPPLLGKLQRKLAGMIEARMAPSTPEAPPAALVATGQAAGLLAILRSWLAGEASCPSDVLARRLAARP